MKTLFVVDDTRVNLFVAEKTLSKEYRVYTLQSASDMFKLLEIIMPDLILLDINMPYMDGFEALTLLKKNRLYSKIPVIFLSSRNDNETKAYGFEIGAVDFIDKPFSTPVLLKQIELHLNMNRYNQIQAEKIQKQKAMA